MDGIAEKLYSIEIKEQPPPYEFVEKELQYELKRNSTLYDQETKRSIPKDRFYLVLFVVGLLGLVHVLPLTFFLTANEYWMYKFRNTTSNSSNANDRTYLQANFVSLNLLYTTLPMVISNFLLAFIAHKIKAMTRIIFTLAFHTVMFSIEALFVNVNTDNWQQLFFIITMIVLIMVMSTISFGAAGQFGLFSKLPPMYINAYLVGKGVAGMFNAVMRLISILISPTPTGSAMIYFCTGSSLMLISTILTIIAGRTEFFRYYNNSSHKDKKEKIRDKRELLSVLKNIKHIIVSNVLYICVPLASIYNLVVSEYEGDSSNVWASQYFVTVATFLIPSTANTIGRFIFSKFNWDCPTPIFYVMVIAYDIITSIFVCLSNAKPRHHLPVLVTHDWEYATGMAIYFFFQGLLSSMMLMKLIKTLPENRVELGILLMMLFDSIAVAAFSPLGVLAVKLI